MDYEEWKESVPSDITKDTLWRMKAYQLALFMTDLGWDDVSRLRKDKRTESLSNQLYRSLGSISANIAEGYSRGTGKDRARFYEYALGSARESRDWYFKTRRVLGEDIAQSRIEVLVEIIRLLLTMVPDQRQSGIRENKNTYASD